MPSVLASALDAAAAVARERTQEAYLVGGYVRDLLLGREPAEADVAVAGDAAGFAHTLGLRLGVSVATFGTAVPLYRVPLATGWIDVTAVAGGLAEDLARRDFTIDALAVPLISVVAGHFERGDVRDRHSGLADIEARRLRLVQPAALRDDPVRALRGVRLACTLRLGVEPATRDAIAEAAPLIATVAPERVAAELQHIFAATDAAAGVRMLDATGLLAACFPVFAEGRGVDQRPWHLYTVAEHQLVALEWMQALIAPERPAAPDAAAAWEGIWAGAEWDTPWGGLRAVLEAHRVPLMLATLLHDVAKPRTRTVEAGGRTRFFGHPELGAQLAGEMLARWRFPNVVTERVALLIEQHMRPGQVTSAGRPPSDRALYRFQAALGDATPDVCFLFLADSLATAGAERLLPRWPAYVERVRRIVCWRPAPAAEGVRRLVGGRAVMAATGLPPGPLLGQVLRGVTDAVMAGEVGSVEAALALARALARAAQAGAGSERAPP